MALLTSCWLWDSAIILVSIFAAIYIYFARVFTHWKRRGIPVPGEPSFPHGHFKGANSETSTFLIPAKLFQTAKPHRFFGFYMYSRPIFSITDPDLLKSILIKDFDAFHDRGIEINVEKEPLAGHLFLLNGQEWKNMRTKLSPTFTSGKMKMMFSTLVDVGKELDKKLEECSHEPETEVTDILARFTTDIISSVAFGLETNSLQNPDAEFRKMGQAIARPTLWISIVNLFFLAFPKIVNSLPIRLIPSNITKFFIGAVRDTIEYRVENNVKRKDFMQLLIELREKGYVADVDHHHDVKTEGNQQKFTIEQAAAQAFIFFFAGFETSSATMSFSLYELALNPELQKQVQLEINQERSKNNGEITYESLHDMSLLDRIVSETLRKYPVAPIIIRRNNAPYKIPDSNVVLVKGTDIWISLYGFHHDPDHFPNPEKFDPNRFTPEECKKRHPYAYFPFGDGPRNCIGSRFGLMQVKLGLAVVLSRFTISPSKKTPIPLVFAPETNVLTFKGDLHLKISLRQK